MSQLPSVLVDAIAPASIYGLIAVGFVLIFRATRVFNFAHGQFVFIGALLFVSAYNHFGSFPISALISVGASMLIGAAMYLVLMRPLTGQGVFTLVMVTLVLGTAVINGVIAVIWGVQVYPLNLSVSRSAIPLPLGTQTNVTDIVTVCTALITIGAIAVFVKRSRFGVEMRAAAESPVLASYSGVNVVSTATVSWAIAIGTAALAGIATAARSPVDSTIISLGLYAFPALILGGMDSIIGALIGSYLLAVVQGGTATYVPEGGLYVDVASYVFMLVVLMVRPYGLFGTPEFRRL